MAPKEIRKSVLIIKSQPRSLAAVESFLKNRGWKIHTSIDVKESLQIIVTQKPSFVMVSVDHPNKKVRALPKLLAQSLPVFVVAFAESNTTAAYKALLDSGAPYRINPPVTGPAVERTINKILRDQELERERAAAVERAKNMVSSLQQAVHAKGETKAGETIRLEGSAAAPLAPGPVYMPDHSGQPLHSLRREALQAVDTLLGNDGDSDAALLDVLQSAAAEVAAASGESADDAAPLLTTIDEPDSILGGELSHGRHDRDSGREPPDELHRPRSSPLTDGANASGDEEEDVILRPGPELSASADDEPETLATTPEKPAALYSEEDFEEDPAEPLARPAGFSGGRGKGPDLSLLEPADLQRERKKRALQESEARREPGRSFGWQKHPEDNVIVRGVQRALDESVRMGDGQIRQRLEKDADHSNVACLVVESAKFSGYLVAALGKNRKMDGKFVDTLKERLAKFLQDNGEPMTDEKSISLKIKSVDFEDWALEYADFLRKSVHEGEEIAMAFFPFAQAQTVVENSAQADMGAVQLAELQGDVNVDFNVYVYLPANRKYVLYTPRGSKFYGTQKERLTRMGVTHMHVKRAELQDVSKYRAQNYLNSKIEEFEKKKSANRVS